MATITFDSKTSYPNKLGFSFRRKLNRIFCILMTALLIIGYMPSPTAFAVNAPLEITNPGANPVTVIPTSSTNGAIWTDKSVQYAGNGEFNVTLSAIGQNYKIVHPVPTNLVDVVLVLDFSGSMDGAKLTSMKNAAKNAVSILLGVAGNRVAIVKYNDSATLSQGFTNSANTLNSKIDASYSGTYTNIQHALLLAQQAILARSSSETNKPIIILMSDGEPNRYYTSVTNHSSVLSSGTNADANSVWNTILQAMEAKNQISNLDIYTIGFGVSTSFAVATLMPTEANTASIRTSSYSGQTRTAVQFGATQYFQERDTYRSSGHYYWNPWTAWALSSVGDTGYVAPSGAITGAWSPFSGYATSPTNGTWSAPSTTDTSISNVSYTDQWTGTLKNSSYERQIGYFDASRSRTEYQNIVLSATLFNHKYWEDGSTITGDTGADGIFNAFVTIVNELISNKPMSFTLIGDVKNYSNITINDVLGNGFDVVGSLPTGVTRVGDTLTWTILGNDFETMNFDSTSIDMSKMRSVSFKVKVNDLAGVGTYYTNASAVAAFNVLDENPAYSGAGLISQNLSNRGWLTLVSPDVNANITVTKTISGPVSNEARDFSFSFYYDATGGSPIVVTPLTVSVTGEDSNSEIQAITIQSAAFNINGNATIYVQENNSTGDPYWSYDNTARKAVTVNRNDKTGEVTFTNTYAPKGTLTVTKVWDGDGPRGSVTFDLQKETTPSYWVNVSTGHSPGSPIGNLDLGTNYRVVETPMQDYTPSFSPASVVFAGQSLEQSIEITNHYVTPVGKITIEKVWSDNQNSAGDRPTQLTFNYTGPTENPSGTVTLSTTAGSIWSNYMQTTVFGEYTFTEVVPQDYTVGTNPQSKTILIDPVADREGTLTFSNTYVEPKGSLTVTKNWTNEGNDLSFRPATVTMELLKDGATTGPSITFPQIGDTPWTYTFNNLDFGSYSILEKPVADYTTSYSSVSVALSKFTPNGGIESRTGGIVVTNSFDNPTGQISVSKEWADFENTVDSNAVRPSQIRISLMNGNTLVDSVVFPENDATPLSHDFTGLPLTGNTYTVLESGVSDEDIARLANYESSVAYGGNGGSADGIVLNHEDRDGTANIVNTYARGTITALKDWVDGNNPQLEQPQSAVVSLYKQVETPILADLEVIADKGDGTTSASIQSMQIGISSIPVLVDTMTITRPNLAVVFYNLEMGAGISYYVTEDSIPFYTTGYSTADGKVVLGEASPNGQITVTNTYDDPRGSLTVNKEWVHGNDPSNPRTVTVRLYANNIFVDGATFSGTHTFNGLTLGAIYTVIENEVANYSTTYNGFVSYTPSKGSSEVASDSVDITNTYIPETGNLEVNKQWVGTTGSAVDITVSRSYGATEDTGFIRTATLDPGNDWSSSFSGLEIYGPGGIAYTYRASESGSDLNLYTAYNAQTPNLNTETTSEITITNTYTPDKGNLTITKVWLGENGQPIAPPTDSIGVILEVNGTPEASSMLLNAGNGWSVTRSGLNVDNTYAVKEATYDEAFNVSYSAESIKFNAQNLDQGITITNQRTVDNSELTVTKSAIKTNAILLDGKATFNYNILIKNTGNRTLTGLYVLDRMTAPAISVVTYTPSPTSIATDGTVRFDLDGTLAPNAERTFSYSVTVDKSGDYANLATAFGSYGSSQVSGSDDATTNVKAPGLSIIKSVIGASSISGSGGTFSYQLIVRNDGEIDLHNVKVVDVMSMGSGNSATYNYTGPLTFDPATQTFTIGDLAKGAEDIVINYTVTVNGLGSYNNTATVTGSYEDPGQLDLQERPTIVTLTDSDSASVSVSAPSRPPHTPDKPVVVPEEPTPAGPVIVPVIDEPIPAAPLPKTGGLDPGFLYGLGALLATGGFVIRRRKDK